MPNPQLQSPSITRRRGWVLGVLALLVLSIPVGLGLRLLHAWAPAHHHDAAGHGSATLAAHHQPVDDAVLEHLDAHAHAASERHHHAPRTADLHLDVDPHAPDPAVPTQPEPRLFTLPGAVVQHLMQPARGDPPARPRWPALDGRAPDGLERPPRGIAPDPLLRAG